MLVLNSIREMQMIASNKEKSLLTNKDYALMQAIILMSPLLTSIMSIVLSINGTNSSIIILIICFIYSYSLIRRGLPRINISIVLLLLGIGILFLSTYLLYHDSMTVSFSDILFFIVLTSMLMMKPAPAEKFLEYIIYLSVLAIPVAKNLFEKSNTSEIYDTISMGLSYALIPSVIAAIVHFSYYRKKSNLLLFVGYGTNIFFIYKLLTMGYRGPVMSLLFPLLCIYLVRFDNKGFRIRKFSIKHLAYIVFGFLVLLAFIVNYNQIIINAYNFFLERNVNVAFLAKMQFLLDEGDVFHGRSNIMLAGVSGFLKSPLWGNGIGVFEYKAGIPGITFPHNFIIQLLYDGGALLAIPVLYVLIKGFRQIFNTRQINVNYPIFIVLVSTSIPRLMFSANMWRVQSFWMLIWFMIISNNKQKKNI